MDGLSFLFEAVASGVGNTWKNKTACLPTCLVGWLTTLVVFPQLVSFPSSPQIGEVDILFMLDGSDWALGELLSYRCGGKLNRWLLVARTDRVLLFDGTGRLKRKKYWQ
jgi:hypothetical protein